MTLFEMGLVGITSLVALVAVLWTMFYIGVGVYAWWYITTNLFRKKK